jgi:hypothetical protein
MSTHTADRDCEAAGDWLLSIRIDSYSPSVVEVANARL